MRGVQGSGCDSHRIQRMLLGCQRERQTSCCLCSHGTSHPPQKSRSPSSPSGQAQMLILRLRSHPGCDLVSPGANGSSAGSQELRARPSAKETPQELVPLPLWVFLLKALAPPGARYLLPG